MIIYKCSWRHEDGRGMPRSKTQSDSEVVRATARVLLRFGPARFTLADVAAETGLSPSTLVQRFGSKRGLMRAFADAAAAEAEKPFERAREQVSSPLGALRAALVAASSELGSRQEVANSLGVLIDDLSDDEMRAAAVRHARRTAQAIRALLDEAVAEGELAYADTEGLALSVQAAWNGAVIQWALRGSGNFEAFLSRVLAPLLPAPARHNDGRSRSTRSPRKHP
jgi:AcrR family transcriptional regulator